MKTKFTFFLTAILLLGQFAFAQTIEVVGVGAFEYDDPSGNPIATLTFTDIDNIDHVEVEAVYKAQDTPPDGPVVFSDADETYQVSATPVTSFYTYDGTSFNTYPSYFQATFNTVDAGGISLDQLSNYGHIHSFIAYVYRNVDNGVSSQVYFDHAFFFGNGVSDPAVFTIPIAAADSPRDINASVVLSEMANDDRTAIIKVTAGDAILTTTILSWDPVLGAALNIVPFSFPDVPGDVTEVQVCLISPSIPFNSGDSFITSAVVLDIEDEPNGDYCTLTQGYYGNYGGIFNGQTTAELLWDLLETDLVLGEPGNSLTLTQSDVDCLIGRLPGGGKAQILNGDATCSNPVGIQLHSSGRFKNILVAQAVTLGLNLRLDGNLGDLTLGEIDFLIYESILNYLGTDATINDLFNLVNDVLAGGDDQGIGLGDFAGAMGKINDYFDECAPLLGEELVSFFKSGVNDSDELNTLSASITAFPNPITNSSTVAFKVVQEGNTVVELVNLQGQVVKQLYKGITQPGNTYEVSLQSADLLSGLYLLRMVSGNEIVNQKISVIR